jgi:hypothetical protein
MVSTDKLRSIFPRPHSLANMARSTKIPQASRPASGAVRSVLLQICRTNKSRPAVRSRIPGLGASIAPHRTALKNIGAPASIWTIRRTIRANKYQWRKAKLVLTSNDPEYRLKVEKITRILNELKDDECFFSIDEYGPFSVRFMPGKKLCAPNEFPSVPQWQKGRGKIILTGALELRTNQITHFYSDNKNTGEMIKMVENVRRRYRSMKVIYISWDAAGWHLSKALRERIEFFNGWAEHDWAPTIQLAPLPSRAQFLNVIESVFSGMSRAVIHNSNYNSVDEAKAAIDWYLADRNKYFREHPQLAGRKIWGKERELAVFSEAHNCKDPRYR